MTNSKPELSLPEDISRLDLIRTRCVRMKYQFAAARSLSMRDTYNQVVIPSTYDRPASKRQSDRKYCVWYEAVLAARSEEPRYNPLWAVDYHTMRRMVANQPVNPQSFCNRVYSGAYMEYGRRRMFDALAVAESTIISLGSHIDVFEVTHGLTPTAAIEELALQTDLDPVMELLWRDLRSIECDDLLVLKARLAYASYPSVYGGVGYPEGWKQRRKLNPLFEVSSDAGELVEAPAVNGLLIA